MDRRAFLGSLAVLAAPLAVHAQRAGRIPRVGVLAPGAGPRPGIPLLGPGEAFLSGLRDHGYVVGQNVIVEMRWDEGRPERHAHQAQELVAAGVDVIVASTTASTLAARKATSSAPIVMAASGGGDPIDLGLAESLGRPGGNVTGLSLLTHVLPGKRLELIKELIPAAAKVALLWNPTRPGQTDVRDHEAAAYALGLSILPFEVRRAQDVDATFQAARRANAQAAVLAQGAFFTIHATKIAEAAMRSRLPTLSGETGYVERGGLMNFGPNIAESWRRSAAYVDKILKGAKPGDLPIEQPSKFELAINLTTAKALGLRIPPSLLARADQVIE
jgi:putative tryptophan/tyrosine transport system substrate-binding protein